MNPNNEYHIISSTNAQVWLVPAEYDGEHRTADDAEALVLEEYGSNEPNHLFYEGLLSSAVSEADRDGISLLRD